MARRRVQAPDQSTRGRRSSPESAAGSPACIRPPTIDQPLRRIIDDPTHDRILHDRHQAEKLCLIDGSSYLYRAFHALPSLTSGEGLPTGRGIRRGQHGSPPDRSAPSGLPGGDLRCAGQELSPRIVRRIQGQPPAHARRPARAARAAGRADRCAGRQARARARRRGRRRDRHAGAPGPGRRTAGADLVGRQGPGPAGRRRRGARRQHAGKALRPRRGGRQVRRRARTGRRPAGADRRHLGQHPGGREGRPEDRGQVAEPIR